MPTKVCKADTSESSFTYQLVRFSTVKEKETGQHLFSFLRKIREGLIPEGV